MPNRPGHRPKYADLAALPEDKRIELACQKCLEDCARVAILTDDTPGKPGRYVMKIHDRFPKVRCLDVRPGPTKGVVTIIIVPRSLPSDASTN